MKALLFCNPLTRRRPHVGSVDILSSAIIVVRPAGTHSRPHVLYVGFARDYGEGSIAVIAVQVSPAEIVGYIQIRRPAGIGVAPGAGETVAIIILVQAGRFGGVDKRPIALVVQEKIWRTIPRIKIGHWIVILIEAQVVAVQAEVNIQTSVAIVVGQGRMGEGPLRRLRKLEGIV